MTYPIPDEALDSDIAIIARKGSGKSYLARGIAERLLDLRRRLLVIDPLGSWWGLRASADGQSAGYPVAVFGGDHGDMPLTASMGEPLARLIAGENLPCVIDTSLMRKDEQGQLAIDLFEGLFRFNKDALTIVLEEADVFAPQNPAKDGYAAKVLHEVDRIARRGRARGLRLISLTQRPARLHKDVLSQAAALVAMRLTSPHDQSAIEDWIKGNANSAQAKEVMDSLATLPVGTGWIWAPDLDMLEKVAFPKIKTLDTSATPKAGETRIEPKTLADVDVSAIRTALAGAAPEGKKAPENITRNITAAPEALLAAEKSGYRNGFETGRTEGYEAGVRDERVRIGKMALAFASQIALETVEPVRRPEVPATVTVTPAPKHKPAETVMIAGAPPGSISSAASAMLATLVACSPLPITAVLWGAFSGRSPVSGPWHKAVSELKAGGFVVTDGGKFAATPAAFDLLSAQSAGIGSEVELWHRWRDVIAGLLGPAAVEMLQALSAYRPYRLTALQWGLLTKRSPISGPWHGAVKVLVKWECIEKSGDRFSVTDKGVQIAQVDGGGDAAGALTAARMAKLSGLSMQIYEALPGDRADLAKRLGKSPISGPWHGAIKELVASRLAAEQDKIIVRIDEVFE